MWAVTLDLVDDREPEGTSAVEDNARDAELCCHISGPREEHVGYKAVRTVRVEEAAEGVAEEGEGGEEGL